MAAADHPDFSGVWMAYASKPSGMGTPNYLSEEGQAKVDAFRAEYAGPIPELGSYCVPAGMPDTMLSMVSYPIEVIHSPDRITILAEMEMQVRRIFMDGRKHPDDYPNTRMGYSIGRWEGDTLVIETRLLKESLLGNWPRTANTRITERVYLADRSKLDVMPSPYIASLGLPIGNDTLVFEITVVDETLYAQPRTITVYYQRVADYYFLEYDCPEEHWLRALEAVKAAG